MGARARGIHPRLCLYVNLSLRTLRTVAFIILAHTAGLDLPKLVASASELRRLGVLLNQSLRVSRGSSVDMEALRDAVQKVKELYP
jgi:hypothetical protein